MEVATPEVPQIESWSDIERLNKERELVGIYLSAHPLDEYRIILENVCNTRCSELSDIEILANKESVTVGGIITSSNTKMSKNGKPYGRVTIEDFTGNGEFVLFGDQWARWSGSLQEGYTIFITARCIDKWHNGKISLELGNIEFLQDVKESKIERLTITMDYQNLDDDIVNDISTMLLASPGKAQLFFQIRDPEGNMHVLLQSRKLKVDVKTNIISYIDANPALEYKIN